MGEIDDFQHAEDEREADRDQSVEQAERDAVERQLQQVDRIMAIDPAASCTRLRN